MAEKKKKRFKKTKRFVGRIFAFNEHRNTYHYLKGVYQDNFTLKDPEQTANYADMKVSAESEERIKSNLKKRLGLIAVFLLLGVILFIFELARLDFAGIVGALIFIAVMLAVAFRYHFWLFQVKQRRLGCTLQEWALATFKLGGGK